MTDQRATPPKIANCQITSERPKNLIYSDDTAGRAESRHSLRVRNPWLGLSKAATHSPYDQNINAAPVIVGSNAQKAGFAKSVRQRHARWEYASELCT